MAPMETMIGLPAFFARTTSRQIVSEATYDPPPLSIRNRIAFHAFVGRGRAEGSGNGVGAHRGMLEDWVVATFAAEDVANAIDERDGGAFVVGRAGAVEVFR